MAIRLCSVPRNDKSDSFFRADSCEFVASKLEFTKISLESYDGQLESTEISILAFVSPSTTTGNPQFTEISLESRGDELESTMIIFAFVNSSATFGNLEFTEIRLEYSGDELESTEITLAITNGSLDSAAGSLEYEDL